MADQIHLSPREHEVLQLVADGHDEPEIAQKLFISMSTVKTRKMGIYRKLGACNAAQAVHLAYQAGVLGVCDPDDLAAVRQAREMGYQIALVPVAGGPR